MREFVEPLVGDVTVLAFLPGGRLAVGGDSGLAVRDPAADAGVRVRGDRKDLIASLAVSGDGGSLAVGTDCYEWFLCDLANGAMEYSTNERHYGDIGERVYVAFAPDGRTLVAASEWHTTVCVVHPARRRPTRRPRRLEALSLGDLTHACFAASKPLLAVVGSVTEGEITRTHIGFWSPRGRAPEPLVMELDRSDNGPHLALSPDGSLLALAYNAGRPDGRVEVWELKARRIRCTFADGPAADARPLAFASDGRRLAVAGVGGVRLVDVQAGGTLAEFAWWDGPASAVAWAADGLTLAAGGPAGRVVVWDAV